jgi:hypothetical protein
MTVHSVVIFVCLAVVVAVLVSLPFPTSRHIPAVCEESKTLQQILAKLHAIERMLLEQRRVINDAHKRITAVSKGIKKPVK